MAKSMFGALVVGVIASCASVATIAKPSDEMLYGKDYKNTAQQSNQRVAPITPIAPQPPKVVGVGLGSIAKQTPINTRSQVVVTPLEQSRDLSLNELNNLEKLKGMIRFEEMQLKATYAPKTGDQVILPTDIADLTVKDIREGYKVRSDFLGKKDKLSVFLSQDNQARHFLGLYKQRMKAWNNGEVPKQTTIQQALNQEARFEVLNIELIPSEVSLDMFRYLEKRLSLRDLDIVKAWVANNTNRPQVMKVSDVIVLGLVRSKMRS